MPLRSISSASLAPAAAPIRRLAPTLLAAVLAVTLAACQRHDAPPPPATAQSAAPTAAAPASGATPGAHDPGVPQNRSVSVTLAADAPQRAFLRIEAVQAVPAALTGALNARVAFDESRTARISPAIAGRVVRIDADLGATVRAGQPLALIDAPDLGSARADVAKARSDETRKRLDRERAERLFEAGVIARRDLEAAVADHEQAAAEARRANLRAANLGAGTADSGAAKGARPADLGGESYALRSPVAGVVVARHVNPGMEVRPDLPDPLFTVADLSRLWIVADLPERDIAQARVGGKAMAEVEAWPGQRFEARIERIAPVLDPATRRVQVIASVANADGRLRPEMFARLSLVADDGRSAIRLPATAVVTDGLYSHVFVEDGNRLTRRKVDVALRDGDQVWIASGLNAGERVVVEGALLVESELAGDK